MRLNMEAKIRKRKNGNESNIDMHEACIDDKIKTLWNDIDGRKLCVCFASVYIFIWLFVHMRIAHFPMPTEPDKAKQSDFVEVRARKHLVEIVRFGPRVAGSESGYGASKYILSEVAKIEVNKNNIHVMETDVQIVSGSFVMNFDAMDIGSYASVYENQLNVVVRIGPRQLRHSLLVNCHFDTVIDSPGASDDAVSCAVMLEMLRALSRHESSLPHNVIFLFNGAEENILQTSHGFITQHKWASSVRAFINLESAGAGGWEMLFQTGPDHPWLIETYIAAAPYPHSSVIGQEIFQAGLVPSDTDFRIFRDYGKIPGLDLAHIRNGYVYHTRSDLPQYVEPGCLQRTGDNILALVKALLASSYLVDPGDRRHGKLVYFDFLGFFMVAYPQRLAVLINSIVVIGVVAMVGYRYFFATRRRLIYLLLVVGSIVFSWFLLLGGAAVIGMFTTAIGRELTYYSHDYNILWIFVCPAVALMLAFHVALKRFLFKMWDSMEIADLYMEANLLIWSAILGVVTFYGFMSAYIPLMFVIGLLSVYLAIWALSLQANKDAVLYCMVTMAGVACPQLYITYQGFLLQTFFIPIMGRVGSEDRPDVIIGVMTMLPVAMVITLQAGLIYLGNKMEQVVKFLVLLTVIGVLAIVFSPIGFPFQSDGNGGSKQRILITHMDRQFHSHNGELMKRDSALWVMSFDHTGLTLLEREAGDLFRDAVQVSCEGTYCGRPHLYPLLSRLDPRSGADHVTIFFSPLPGCSLVNYMFGHVDPVGINILPDLESADRDTYFIYYAYGRRPTTPWRFNLYFNISGSLAADDAVVDITFVSHYMHGHLQYTVDMQEFVSKLPDWTTVNGWSSVLDAFRF